MTSRRSFHALPKPPDPIPEEPPDQKPKGDNVQWIPGYWAWDDDRQDFLWVSGCWRVPPSGRNWRGSSNFWSGIGTLSKCSKPS